jgi:hypothetical protein
MPTRNAYRAALILTGLLLVTAVSLAEDAQRMVRKAAEKCTLNQPGTKPFHLKAELAPSLERDKGSKRTGSVEIWWASPTQWKRDARSDEFHQILIVSGGKEWQQTEGEYFPEWLRELSVALIEPIPDLDAVLKQVADSDVRNLMGSVHVSWEMMSSDGKIEKAMGAGIDVDGRTGLLSYGGALGWGGGYKDYQNFHGRMVARKVSGGSPEVTARVTILEDLKDIPNGLFDIPTGEKGDLLHTIVIPEGELRKNLQPGAPVDWPALRDGPLDGAVTTEVVVDRVGRVREVGTIVSDNPGLSETAGKFISAMQFKPYLQNGSPVQVVSRITMPFKTKRPEGTEAFESARTYFERGRRVCFPAAGNGPAYVLHATIQARVSSGTVADGEYTDTWKSEHEWRREAKIGKSRFARSRFGDKYYLSSEGPDASLLRLVLKAVEPIPAVDTFYEADWRIKRDTVDGTNTIRVLAGYESPAGELDPEQARGYWFDESGRLIKTYFHGIESRRLEFQDFGGAQVARRIALMKNGSTGVVIHVTEIAPAADLSTNTFKVGQEWKRAFTDEVR